MILCRRRFVRTLNLKLSMLYSKSNTLYSNLNNLYIASAANMVNIASVANCSIIMVNVKTSMAMTTLNFVIQIRLIPTDFAVDSLAFDAFVDDEVMYSKVNRQFVAAKHTPHMLMMVDGMHPVHVVANCNKGTRFFFLH